MSIHDYRRQLVRRMREAGRELDALNDPPSSQPERDRMGAVCKAQLADLAARRVPARERLDLLRRQLASHDAEHGNRATADAMQRLVAALDGLPVRAHTIIEHTGTQTITYVMLKKEPGGQGPSNIYHVAGSGIDLHDCEASRIAETIEVLELIGWHITAEIVSSSKAA